MQLESNDPRLNAFLSSLRALLMVLGTVLAGHGMTQSKLYAAIELTAGSVMVVGPAVWGVIVSFQNLMQKRQAVAQGVQAGINMTLAGGTLDIHGKTIEVGSSPPSLPVTPATAQEIVKTFGTGDGTVKAL